MFNDPIEEQQVDQLSEKDRKAKMATEVESDGTEATKKEQEVDPLSEKDIKAKMAVEVEYGGTEVTKQEQEVDQLSEKDRKAKMAEEVESDGTEATKQDFMALNEEQFKLAMVKTKSKTSGSHQKVGKKQATPPKGCHKRSPSMIVSPKQNIEQHFNAPEMSEEAPANAMETMKTFVMKEEPIEDDLSEESEEPTEEDMKFN